VTGIITVGVDESDGARDALCWAVHESCIRRARVVAVLAWGFLDQHSKGPSSFNPDYCAADADAALQHMVADALTPELALSVERTVVCDLPARALLEASVGSDMLVVGARGFGGFSGLLLGSVSQKLVHHAAVPTVVVRHSREKPGPAGVVVGIDGSDGGQRALAWAANEARRRSVPLTVVHGYQAPLAGAYPYTTMMTDTALMPRAARRLVSTALEHIDSSSLEVVSLCLPGGAAHTIVESAAEADLVVVGSRGLGAVQRLLLGSVATQVLLHAPVSVAVIPHDKRANGTGGGDAR
jgi:nucleotide-binding universal stress UspA family protein